VFCALFRGCCWLVDLAYHTSVSCIAGNVIGLVRISNTLETRQTLYAAKATVHGNSPDSLCSQGHRAWIVAN